MNLLIKFINCKINNLKLNNPDLKNLIVNNCEIFYDLLNNSIQLMLNYLTENMR